MDEHNGEMAKHVKDRQRNGGQEDMALLSKEGTEVVWVSEEGTTVVWWHRGALTAPSSGVSGERQIATILCLFMYGNKAPTLFFLKMQV